MPGSIPDVKAALDDPYEGMERLPNGHLEMTLTDGTVLSTHGGDPKPSHGSWSWISTSLSRQPICATDYYFHVLYGRLSSQPDRSATARNEILRAVKNTDYLLNMDAVASGNHTADLKVLCDPYNEVEIGSFTSGSENFSAVIDAARAAGFNKSNVKYLIFFDTNASSYCGIANFRTDERLSTLNSNNYGGNYALSHRDCWSGRTPLHEAGHTMGAVQWSAPYSTGTGAHCAEDVDVMCYSPDGGDRNQAGTVDRCTDRVHFDCQFDTYFDTEAETGEYLATNWNIGDRYVNRFLAFDGTTVAPSNRPPTPIYSWSCTDSTCSFYDQSYDLDGSISSWSWAFGNGVTSTVRNPVYTYPAAGDYNVTLTVVDSAGGSASLSKPVAVYPTDPDPSTPTLPRGQNAWDYVGAQGSWRYYKVIVTEEKPSLAVTLDGPPCTTVWLCERTLQTLPGYGAPFSGVNLDLYVQHGSRPTSSSWICRPYASHSDESCNISNPTPGVWYIGVNVYWATPGYADYVIRADF